MSKTLWRLLGQSLVIYTLFLAPTFLLLFYAGSTDASISRQIDGAWQAGFWHFSGLNATASRILLDILTAIAVGALGWFYYQGWKTFSQIAIPENKLAERRISLSILGWTACCAGILLLVIPFHSSDLYGYLNRGFQQSLYHTNPYLTPIVKIPGWEREPLFHPHWIYNPCPYGFFFAQLTSWITSIFGRSFEAAFLLFKVLNWLLLLGTTSLLLALAQRLGLERPWLIAYAFGANPLVLLHVMGNGHNDILMVFLLLAALWQLDKPNGRWTALPLLMLSVLVKYASVLALPFVMLYLWKRQDWRSLTLGSLAALFLLGLLAAMYINLHQPWPWADMLDNAGKPQHSVVDLIARAVYYPVKWAHGPATESMALALRFLKPLFWGGFALFYLRQMWQFARQKEVGLSQVIFATGISLAVMVAFISAKFHPWYTVMFLPLLLLLPEQNRWRQFGQIFSLFQLAGFTIFQNLPVLSPLALTILPAWLAFRRKKAEVTLD